MLIMIFYLISILFFAVPKPCSIDFKLGIDKSENCTGYDLAMYKAEEPMASPNDTYEIWLLLATSASITTIEIALIETINASCSGWQMFHLDNTAMANFLDMGSNITNFEVVVFKNDDYYSLSCDKVHSLFIFNTTAHRSNPTNQTNSTTGDQNPFSKDDKELKYFTPVLNIFRKEKSLLSGLFKREAGQGPFIGQNTLELNDSNPLSTVNPCELKDHWVKVNSTLELNGDIVSVLGPRVYNARRCLTMESRKCHPIRERFLTTLMEKVQGGQRTVFKKISEYKIVEQCG